MGRDLLTKWCDKSWTFEEKKKGKECQDGLTCSIVWHYDPITEQDSTHFEQMFSLLSMTAVLMDQWSSLDIIQLNSYWEIQSSRDAHTQVCVWNVYASVKLNQSLIK